MPDAKEPSREMARAVTSSSEGEGEVFTANNPEHALALQQYVAGTAVEKRLVWKLDLIVLPSLWWMYILAYMDRGNIANANAAGFSKDMGMSDGQYAFVISIFFIGYSIFEVPSNLLLAKLKPSVYLSTIMIIWGALVAAMSTADTVAKFYVARLFLGCIEAGLFPGALFLITCWYKKAETGKRFAIFYSSGLIAPALGGIVAGAIIGKLDGARGWPGWRWLFLIEGVVTVFFGFVFLFVLVDYPLNTTKYFTPEEQQIAYVRILHDKQQDLDTDKVKMSSWKALLSVLLDPKAYVFLALYVLDSTATSISYFIPTTLRAMGYTKVTAQWMTAPIWFSAAIMMVIVLASSDYLRDKRWHTVGAMLVGLVTTIICLSVNNAKVRYAMLCFYVAGIYSGITLILGWTAEVMSFPNQKRSVALAFVNSFGNLAIIWGSRLWISKEAPGYRTGFSTVAGMTSGAAVIAFMMPYTFRLFKKIPAFNKADKIFATPATETTEV